MLLALGLMGLAQGANAACASPAGNAGDMGYAGNYGTMVFCNGNQWVSMAGGVSVTVNTSGGGGATPAGSTWDVQFNNSGALAADTANFTYTQTAGLLKAPNISATAITASGLGTFGTALINGGMTVTGQASVTTVSSTLMQLISNTTTACTAGLAGAQRYNSTSNTIDYCSGSAWLSMGPSSTQPISFRVDKNGTDQAVTASTNTKLTWSHVAFDTNNNFASNRFTATVPGKYLINLTVSCNTTGSNCRPMIYKNGAVYQVSNVGVSTGAAHTVLTSAIVDLGVGDYVEAYAFTSGTNIFGDPTYTTFDGVLLSPQGGGSGGTANPGGSTNDVQFNSGGLLAADTGNFTYASSTLKTPSLLTGGITATGQASLTTVSTTLVQLISNTTTACTSNLAGAQRYNSTSNTVDYCSGSAWLSLGPSSTSPVSFMVTKGGTNQTVTANTVTKLTWSTKTYDTNNNFSTATSKYTPTVPGKYLVILQTMCTDSGSSACDSYIEKNGVSVATAVALASNWATPTAATIVEMNGTTDYLEAYVKNIAGTSINGQTDVSFFGGVLLSPQGGSGGGATPAGSTNDVQFNSGGLLAADTGKFTYNSATGTVSATTISTTAVNIASVTTIANVVGGSGNMIASGSAVVSTSSAGSITFYTGGSQRMVIGSNGRIGLGLSNPQADLDMISANSVNGGIRMQDNLTDSTNKYGRMKVGHYLNAQPPVSMIIGASGNTLNTLYLGGGSGSENSMMKILFYTGANYTTVTGSERMRIDENGNLSFGGLTDPTAAPNPGMTFQPSVGTVNIGNSAGASGAVFAGFYRSGTKIGSITQNGTTAVAYNTTSDRRVKENITDSREGLQKLMEIGVKDFSFKADPSHTIVNGFIAQDLEHVYPEAVTTNGDNGEVPLKDKSKIWQVDYGRVTPLIVKAVQDLNIKTDEAVKSLKADNDNLRIQLKAANDNAQSLRNGLDSLRKEFQELKQQKK